MENNIFDKFLKKKKMAFFIYIFIFVFIAISLFIYIFYDHYYKEGKAKNLIEEEKIASYDNIYIDTVKIMKIGVLSRSEDDKFLYLLVDNQDYCSVALLTDKQFQKITNKLKINKSVKVYGHAIAFNKDIQEKTLNMYNKIIKDEYRITKDEFTGIFGEYYLNAINWVNTAVITTVCIIMGFSFILFLLFLSSYIKNYKKIKSYDKDTWEEIKREAKEKIIFSIKKNSVLLTENYFIYLKEELIIVDYKDILWAYYYEQYINGFIYSLNVVIYDTNKKRYAFSYGIKNNKNKKEILQILEIIKSKNENILIEYNKNTKEIAKEKYGIK